MTGPAHRIAPDAEDSPPQRADAPMAEPDQAPATERADQATSGDGNPGEALTELEPNLSDLPAGAAGRRSILVRLAEAAERTGDYAAALDYWAMLSEEFPDDNRGLRRPAALCQRIGDQERAIPLWEECIRRFPDNHNEIWINALAEAYLETGRVDAMRERLQKKSTASAPLIAGKAHKPPEDVLFARMLAHAVRPFDVSTGATPSTHSLRILSAINLSDPELRRRITTVLIEDEQAEMLRLLYTDPRAVTPPTVADITAAAVLRRWGYGATARHLFDDILHRAPSPPVIAAMTRVLPVIFDGEEEMARRRALATLAEVTPHPYGSAAQSLNLRVALLNNLLALGDWPRLRALLPEVAAESAETARPYEEYLRRVEAIDAGAAPEPKVFVIGLSKTGTTSMTGALEMLGYHAAHWVNPMTGRILDDLDIEVYEALTDTSIAWRFEELDARFPGSKFIYTTRPLAEWKHSLEKHYHKYHNTEDFAAFRASLAVPDRHQMGQLFLDINENLYGLDTAEACYAAYHERVQAYFQGAKRAQLLEFDVFAGDGFEKLCAFLDRPVPEARFPWQNRTEADPDAPADLADPSRRVTYDQRFGRLRRLFAGPDGDADVEQIADFLAARPGLNAPYWHAAQGRQCMRRKFFDRAEQAFAAMKAADPDSVAADLEMARLAAARGDAVTAVRLFEEVYTAHPVCRLIVDSAVIYNACLRKVNRLADADDHLDEMIGEFPDNSNLLAHRIDRYLETFDLAGAAKCFRAATRRFGNTFTSTVKLLRFRRSIEMPDYWPDWLAVTSGHMAMLHLNLQVASEGRDAMLDLGRQYLSRFSHNVGLKSAFVNKLSNHLESDAEAEELRAVAQEILAHPKAQHFDCMTAAKALISLDDLDGAAAALQEIDTTFGKTLTTARLEARVAAAQGDFARALALDDACNRNLFIRSLHADLGDFRRISEDRGRGLRGKVIVLTCMKDERPFLENYFRYYRGIGVDHFFIVDNGSSDGSDAYCLAQSDATVFRTRGNFYKASAGMRWINALMDEYGAENWCLFIDVDEELILPGLERRGIGPVLDDLRQRGDEIVGVTMLDTFPERMGVDIGYRETEPLRAYSPWFDGSVYFSGAVSAPFFSARGGVRSRCFATSESLEKAPVVWGSSAVRFLSNHSTTIGRVSQTRGALLHHSLLRNAAELSRKGGDIANLPRFLERSPSCRARYQRYAEMMAEGEDGVRLAGPTTVAYRDEQQLLDLGLMR